MGAILEVGMTMRIRHRVARVLQIVFFIQLTLSIIVISLGYTLMKSLAAFDDIVRGAYTHAYYPKLVVVCGLCTAFLSLGAIQACLGASDWKRMFRGTHTWQTALAICYYAWILGCLFLLSVYITTGRQHSPIRRAFLVGMKEAMTLYRTNSDVKEKIDRIQMNWRCCGSLRHSEWFGITWVDTAYVNLMSGTIQQQMEGGLLLTNSVPWSCCDIMAARPCIEVDILDRSKHFAYDPSKDLTIYTAGCADQLTASIHRRALDPVGSILLTLAMLAPLSTVVYRYLQSSTDVALTSGDPTVAAPGYIYCSGEAPKPIDAPATFDALQERLEALDELANLTDHEIAERVKELRAKKEAKEKKLRERKQKKSQRRSAQQQAYKWLEDWTPAVPPGVGGGNVQANNATNANNAAADTVNVNNAAPRRRQEGDEVPPTTDRRRRSQSTRRRGRRSPVPSTSTSSTSSSSSSFSLSSDEDSWLSKRRRRGRGGSAARRHTHQRRRRSTSSRDSRRHHRR